MPERKEEIDAKTPKREKEAMQAKRQRKEKRLWQDPKSHAEASSSDTYDTNTR